MRVIACGSRGWTDRDKISERFADLVLDNPDRFLDHNEETITIVVGYDPVTDRPRGADRIAYQEAQKHGFLVETHPADWQRHGKRAGPIRNEKMATLGADLCIAFWDGRSSGTEDMMNKAKHHGIPVEVIR